MHRRLHLSQMLPELPTAPSIYNYRGKKSHVTPARVSSILEYQRLQNSMPTQADTTLILHLYHCFLRKSLKVFINLCRIFAKHGENLVGKLLGSELVQCAWQLLIIHTSRGKKIDQEHPGETNPCCLCHQLRQKQNTRHELKDNAEKKCSSPSQSKQNGW